MQAQKKKIPEKLLIILYISITILLLMGAVIFSVGYDKGYRIKGISIQKVGTISMNIPEKNTWVFIGEKPVHKSTTAGEIVTIPHIEPGKQLVTVIKDTYFPWTKRILIPSDDTLIVHPFLLKQNVEAHELGFEDKEYFEITRFFFNPINTPHISYQTDTHVISATSTGISVTSLTDMTVQEIIPTEGPVNEVYMFKDNPNVALYSTEKDIWVTELITDTRLTYQIFEGQNIRLYPKENFLYIKNSTTYYKIRF